MIMSFITHSWRSDGAVETVPRSTAERERYGPGRGHGFRRQLCRARPGQGAARAGPRGRLALRGVSYRRSGRLAVGADRARHRSEEHTSELQSLMRISYAVFCLKKKKQKQSTKTRKTTENRTKVRKRTENRQ